MRKSQDHIYPEYLQDVSECCQIHRRFGKSFYMGTRILPQDQRRATCILYAFLRYPDEIVDTLWTQDEDRARSELLSWKDKWRSYYNDQEVAELNKQERSILRANKYIFEKYRIPFEYSQSFFDSMLLDTTKKTYKSYQELEQYMYGSAVVVGYMMTYIFNHNQDRFHNDNQNRQKVLKGAKALAEAFQMTNFIRDVKDDSQNRGRIYLPLEDLKRFDLKPEDIKAGFLTPKIKDLIKFEIKRTDKLYIEAQNSIDLLPKTAEKPVYLALVLYSEILRKIKKRGYNIFAERIHLSLREKLFLALQVIFKVKKYEQ